MHVAQRMSWALHAVVNGAVSTFCRLCLQQMTAACQMSINTPDTRILQCTPAASCQCIEFVVVLLQINKYAFSGGGATLEEHRAKGANLDVDVPWKYLNFFMEDDEKLAHIGREYGAGRMLTGESAGPW